MRDQPPVPTVKIPSRSTDATGRMAGHGYYDAHALAQSSAGGLGLPLLERAVEAVSLPAAGQPLVIADLGSAGGHNELAPMAVAIDRLRNARGHRAPIVVVHTDIPTNDFTTLFQTIERDPGTYLRPPEVYAFAAGRSFFDRIFPPATVTLGWSAVAVHWLSRVPTPIPDHVYCSFAQGEVRDALATQSAADWGAFLAHRAAELRPGGELVVVGGAARDDGSSGAEALMNALDGALRDAVAAGRIRQDEYRTRTIPTWNRTLAEFEAPFSSEGAATSAGLTLVESALAALPDQYLPAYRASGDGVAFANAVTGFVRAFTESSLIETLHRRPEDRTAIADAVYCNLYDRLVNDPLLFETTWHVALLRIARAT